METMIFTRDFPIGSPHLLFMTLDAQVRGRGEGDHFLVRRPVRAMTTQAIYAQIFIPQITDLLSDGVRGMLPPIVATAA
jgi:hypothetical protein